VRSWASLNPFKLWGDLTVTAFDWDILDFFGEKNHPAAFGISRRKGGGWQVEAEAAGVGGAAQPGA
jgi:hypothetical protein